MPYRSIASRQVSRGSGVRELDCRPRSAKRSRTIPSMRIRNSSALEERGLDVDLGELGLRSARISSSRKQRTIW